MIAGQSLQIQCFPKHHPPKELTVPNFRAGFQKFGSERSFKAKKTAGRGKNLMRLGLGNPLEFCSLARSEGSRRQQLASAA